MLICITWAQLLHTDNERRAAEYLARIEIGMGT